MSAQSRPVLVLPYLAASAVIYARFVALTGTAPALPGMAPAATVTTAGAKCHGVANRPALLGEGFDATVYGTAVVEAGAAVTAGAKVAADANGRAIAQTGTAETAGVALRAAAQAGDLIEVLLVI
jgi:hypothetical protein